MTVTPMFTQCGPGLSLDAKFYYLILINPYTAGAFTSINTEILDKSHLG